MKKFLKILLIVLGVLFVLLIVTPIFFKKPIEKLVKTQINNTVNAKVDFTDFKLSFIRGFPNVYIALENLTVVGTGEFEKDTLISFRSFSVKVDLISAIKMKNIKVKSVLLDYPRISAKVLKNGKANWDIMKPSNEKAAVDTTPSKPIDFGASLKKFEITHAYIKYQDDTSKMSADIKDLNFLLAGDFSAKQTDMSITTSIESLDFIMGGVKYLKKAKIGFVAQLGADLEKSIYTIKNNEIKLNDLSLSLEGLVKMPTDAIEVDMKYKTNKADFKSILSMVPAIYMKDFESVQTSGNLKLDGYVKGTYAGKKMPNVGLNLIVEKAMFRYPSLPKSVENINIDMSLLFDGVQNDNSTVDVNKFHLELAGNPFDINLHIKTPISDMNIVGNFTGKIDLNSIADVVPMDSLTLKGKVEANIDIMGKMSSLEKQQYEDFKADGSLKLDNFEFASPLFPQGVKIVTATMNFSPKFVELVSFDSRVGKSDFKLSGKLEKFIPYVFKNDTIAGSLNFTSNLTDVTELMGPAKTPAKPAATDTTQLSVIGIPANINFVLNSKIGQLNYDKLKITDIAGLITVRNSKATLKNLNMNLLEGSMIMNGTYSTQNIKNPSFDFGMNMKDIDIPSAYTAFNTIQKMAPVAQNCKGRVSIDLTLSSYLDPHMMPMYKSMEGKGRLQSKSVELANSNTFIKIADVLKNDKFRKLTLSDLDIKFEIKNGRIYLSPFDTKFGNIKMNIAGDQGIDQTLNYVIKTAIPRSEFSGAAGAALNLLTSSAVAKGLNIQQGDNVNINIGVQGTFLKPEVKPIFGGSDESSGSTKTQVKAVAEEKVKEAKQELSQKAKEQAEKLVKDAESEAQKIRDAAKVAADATRKEGNDAADKVEHEAKNPLLKAAAKKTAEKMRKESDAKANKIVEEGNTKADGVVNKAKEEAAKIK
jgi:hypothetical protein